MHVRVYQLCEMAALALHAHVYPFCMLRMPSSGLVCDLLYGLVPLCGPVCGLVCDLLYDLVPSSGLVCGLVCDLVPSSGLLCDLLCDLVLVCYL